MPQADTLRLVSFELAVMNSSPLTITAERLDHMTMAGDIPLSWALLLLNSSWPPQRLRERAMEIIARSLPPRLAGPIAALAVKDLTDRTAQSTQVFYHNFLFVEGLFLAVSEIVSEVKQREVVYRDVIRFYNDYLRSTPLAILKDPTQRQQLCRSVQSRYPDLDMAVLDWVFQEVATVVEKDFFLEGRSIEVPRSHGEVIVGPDWDLDERGYVHARIWDTEWAKTRAGEVIRNTYRQAHRNLREWLGSGGNPTGMDEAAIPQPLLNPEKLCLAVDEFNHALRVVDTPYERAVLRMLVEGFSPEEMAEAMARSRAATYKIIQRLRRKVATILRESRV